MKVLRAGTGLTQAAKGVFMEVNTGSLGVEGTEDLRSPPWFHLYESQTDLTPLTAPRHTDPSLSYVTVYA